MKEKPRGTLHEAGRNNSKRSSVKVSRIGFLLIFNYDFLMDQDKVALIEYEEA
jgi:hypothetical protein